MQSIAHLRKDYSLKALTESDVKDHPLEQFDIWWSEAIQSQIEEVNAMTLATATAEGVPSARIVLLKEYNDKGFVFFTNYESAKGHELAENPRASLLFFWKELERQVRITGLVEKISAAESDAYFYSRPLGSRIGAIASAQSSVIDNREVLEQKVKTLETKSETEIKRPAHWGGYRVKPVIIEFWQGRPSRLHDRIQYSLEENGKWKIERLSP
ncbi:MAG: pyridoxamine 5'-phosphate oxidase [Chitinophagaceae bacterium]|nr:pyridoxamine 5'-phosphate oxidase [Chitinophagaceae bacterium]